MTNLKIGTILIAKEDMKSPNGVEITKGKEYKIEEIETHKNFPNYYLIKVDSGKDWKMAKSFIEDNFTIKRYTLSDLQARTDIMVRIKDEKQAKKLKDAGIQFEYFEDELYYGKQTFFVWLTKNEQKGRTLLDSIDEIDIGDEGKEESTIDYREPIAMKAGDKRVLVNGLVLPVDFRIISEGNYKQLESEIARLKGEVEQLIEEKRILISQLKDSYGIDRQSPDLTKR